MLIRRDGGPSWVAPRGLTFRGWLRGELGSERPPTIDDLTYHLSTLFPPVRPRGHLELRMIDAQCGDGWIVPAAVAWALLEDPRAADTAMAAAEPLWAHPGDGGAGTTPPSGLFGRWPFGLSGQERSRHDGRPGAASTGAGNSGHNGHRAGNPAPSGNPWLRAARDGPADPVLARASQRCFEAADAALGRAGAPAEIRRRVAEFAERYVLRSRCPADDQLEGMQ